jgi:plasmid segregation protein ParM
MRDKSEGDHFFLLTLFGIAKELERSGAGADRQKITLAAGIPPAHIQDDTGKRLRKRLRCDMVSFEYNEKPYNIVISDVFVCPQAYAAVAPIWPFVKRSPLIYIVDIGGMTVDMLLLRYGKPDANICISLDRGVITMKNSIVNMVNASQNIPVDEEQIDIVLRGGKTDLPESVKNIITESCAKYAADILHELTEQGVKMRGAYTAFVGGGSLLLRNYIDDSYLIGNHDIIEGVNANAVGYKLLAEQEEKQARSQV